MPRPTKPRDDRGQSKRVSFPTNTPWQIIKRLRDDSKLGLQNLFSPKTLHRAEINGDQVFAGVELGTLEKKISLADKPTDNSLAWKHEFGIRLIKYLRKNVKKLYWPDDLFGQIFLTAQDFETYVQRNIRRSKIKPPPAEPPKPPQLLLTETDVKDRYETLLKSDMYGRRADLRKLITTLSTRDRGVLILAAPSGTGKSTLMARLVRWARGRQHKVAAHFISTKYPATTQPVDVLRHLAWQIRKFGDQAAGGASQALPESERDLLDELASHVVKDAPGGKRIIFIDGVDELQTPLMRSFIPLKLGKGVFVVIAGRVREELWPSELRIWRDSAPAQMERHDLKGLRIPNVLRWLQDKVAHLDEPEMQNLAERLHAATNGGTPLFLKFVFEDIPRLFPQATTPEERRRIVERIPSSFTEYLREELAQIEQDPDGGWNPATRRLFALLSSVMAPISESDLVDFFDARPAAHQTDPGFNTLPRRRRISRWLDIREIDGQCTYAFDHPQLAEHFRKVLQGGPQEPDRVESEFIDWMITAWKPSDVVGETHPGSAYALDWLPAHLLRTGRATNNKGRLKRAAELLSSHLFLAERLRLPQHALDRFDRSMREWFQLDFATRELSPNAAHWSAFWAENENRLEGVLAFEVLNLRLPAQVVLKCFADTAPNEYNDLKEIRRARVSRTPKKSQLLRRIPNAHSNSINGISVAGPNLVSWSDDGAIRFWTPSGNVVNGGAPNAHGTGVGGVITLHDRLLSWDADGNVRFWTFDGKETEKGVTIRHDYRIKGVTVVSNSLVSWDTGGALRFWTLNGDETEGGAKTAHGTSEYYDRGVGGIAIVGPHIVSWGDDGAIRFWTLLGSEAEGGSRNAHGTGVGGVITLHDRLLSWGTDGTVRFWTLDGKEAERGFRIHHNERIRGVTVVRDRLVSWGQDGAIRLWTLFGGAIEGGCEDAHGGLWGVDGVLVTGEFLVSWGGDTAIRLWNLNGARAASVSEEAHGGNVFGVAIVEDRLVSWGSDGERSDGEICFWNICGGEAGSASNVVQERWKASCTIIAGEYLVSWSGYKRISFWKLNGDGAEALAAFDTGVHGVVALRDRLLSWHADGNVRFWTFDGKEAEKGFTIHHDYPVQGVTVVSNSLVSWDEGGTLRFWTLNGERAAGISEIARKGKVYGVANWGDRLVTWGQRGICLWHLNGDGAGVGPVTAPQRVTRGVTVFGNHLVGWGLDGAIRFWTLNGARAEGGSETAHKG